MENGKMSRPLELKAVRIDDAFWSREQELVRREVIPYQWEALNDRVEGAAPSYCMHNFRAAGRRLGKRREEGREYKEPVHTFRGFETLPEDPHQPDPEQFYGFVFQDSDFYKWIESVGYVLAAHPDPYLERTADEAIGVVCAAQMENGYLDTYYILNGIDRAFTNLRDHHELYCFGHLTEGAIAYYQATGKDRLLRAAMRFADYIDSCFGPQEGKRKGYPGHEIAEMALARLYEVTGERRYLELSKFFLDMRGTQPYYFDREERERAVYEGKAWRQSADPRRYVYYQAQLPVRELKEAAGHAVRAVYLYSGMADAARLTGDEALYEACVRLWDDITGRKLYVTGGIGATHLGEAFSFPYDLPNDTVYAETCAAIGLMFFARRLLQISPEGRFGDVMERALYNGVLSGMALDGRSFFYVNPLEVDPEACMRDPRKAHVKPSRQKWFGCACCPPNLARLIASLGMYAYTEREDVVWFHLYVGGTVTKRVGKAVLKLKTESGLPWDGRVRVTIDSAGGEDGREKGVGCTLAFRVPGWSGCTRVLVEREGGCREELVCGGGRLQAIARECVQSEGTVRECVGAQGAERVCVGAQGATRECVGAEGAVRVCVRAEGAARECVQSEAVARECVRVEGAARECVRVEGAARECVRVEGAARECVQSEAAERVCVQTEGAECEGIWAEAAAREGIVSEGGAADLDLSRKGNALRARLENGYLYLTADWRDADSVTLDFSMEIHMEAADPRVREDIGKAAFTRGPLVYCMEEADNGKALHQNRVDLGRVGEAKAGIAVEDTEELGHRMKALLVPGKRLCESGYEILAGKSGGMPVQGKPVGAPDRGPAWLYREYRPPVERETVLKLIPYYAWNNRGEGEMAVWIRV